MTIPPISPIVVISAQTTTEELRQMTTTTQAPVLQDFSASFVKVGSAWRVMTSKRVEPGTGVLVNKKSGTSKLVVVTDEGTETRDRRGNTGYWLYSFRDATSGRA